MDLLLLLILIGAVVSAACATLLVQARVNLVGLALFFLSLYFLVKHGDAMDIGNG